MKQFTVHLDVDVGTGERNDFLVQVDAVDVKSAVNAAVRKVQTEQELDDSDIDGFTEILEVYQGHVVSLWNRPDQEPI